MEHDSLVHRESDEVAVHIVARDASVPGYAGLVVLETESGAGRAWSWYEATAGSVLDVAYSTPRPPPMAEPRPVVPSAGPYGLPRTVAELAGARLGPGAGGDSLIVRDDPRVVYELPLKVRASWVSFTDPFWSAREVVGQQTVTVAAGTFACFVIRTEIGAITESDTFEWLDYVSEEHGLVLRTTESVYEYRGPSYEPLGLVRTVERLERTVGP